MTPTKLQMLSLSNCDRPGSSWLCCGDSLAYVDNASFRLVVIDKFQGLVIPAVVLVLSSSESSECIRAKQIRKLWRDSSQGQIIISGSHRAFSRPRKLEREICSSKSATGFGCESQMPKLFSSAWFRTRGAGWGRQAGRLLCVGTLSSIHSSLVVEEHNLLSTCQVCFTLALIAAQ